MLGRDTSASEGKLEKSYVGKLVYNFSGSEFILFDHGSQSKRHATIQYRMSGPSLTAKPRRMSVTLNRQGDKRFHNAVPTYDRDKRVRSNTGMALAARTSCNDQVHAIFANCNRPG